jgi:uncharacterized membrane protein YfcA
MIETVLGYLIGLLVGIIMGLLGGGGSLLLPALMYFLHFELNFATAYTTILVGITALFGAMPRIRQKLIDGPTFLALGIPVSVGMLIVRVWLYEAIPDTLFSLGPLIVTKTMFVLTLFSSLLLLSFASLIGLIGKNFKPKENLRQERPVTYYATLTVCGLLIGILPGFTGAGGGVLIVPLLVILIGLPMQTVVGTSLSIVAMKSFVGFFGGDAIRLGAEVDYRFLAMYSVLMIVGVLIGSQMSRKVDGEKLKKIFAWFLLALAIYIILREVVFK